MGIFDLFEKPKVEKEFYENGKLKNEATYKSGKKNGPGKGYHENGKLHYKGEWINGKQDGEITSYDEDGNKKKQSFFKKGSYEGPQKEWWPNGKLRADRIMKNNEIISEETYSQNGTVVVFEDKIEDIGIVSHYKGKPFTGIMFVDPYATLKNWWVNEQYEMVDGLKDGLKSEFHKNGKIKMQTKFSKDKFVNIIGYFDLEGNNLIETEICLAYNMLEEKNDIYYHGDKPYNGSVIYVNGAISIFADGIKVSSKHYFLDGTIKTISEIVDGKLVELKGWIKIDDDGNYDENGKKILVREFKDGRKIEYYENGNKKSEKDVNTIKSDSDSSNSFVEIKYYENGNLHTKEIMTKNFGKWGMSGGNTIEYSEFYETGELKTEKVDDEKYTIKHISYFKNKTIQSIAISDTPWLHQGHTFEFDEKGNETTSIDAKSEKEHQARKYLKLLTASKDEISKANEKENERLNKKITIDIQGIIFETTIGKFENAGECAIHDEYGSEVEELNDDEDEFTFYLSSVHDAVAEFFKNFTDKKLVVTTDYYAHDEELGEIGVEEVAFINCECPENLKKYYNGQLFISDRGKLLETDSDDYKKINFDEIWETSEIRNSGVECTEYSEYLKHI